jgi:hypothetical protein
MYEDFEDFFLSKKYDFFGGMCFFDVGRLVLVWVTRSGESGVDIFFADVDNLFGMMDGFLGMS